MEIKLKELATGEQFYLPEDVHKTIFILVDCRNKPPSGKIYAKAAVLGRVKQVFFSGKRNVIKIQNSIKL